MRFFYNDALEGLRDGIDNDHFKTTWTFLKEQKDAFTEDVTYVRTK